MSSGVDESAQRRLECAVLGNSRNRSVGVTRVGEFHYGRVVVTHVVVR